MGIENYWYFFLEQKRKFVNRVTCVHISCDAFRFCWSLGISFAEALWCCCCDISINNNLISFQVIAFLQLVIYNDYATCYTYTDSRAPPGARRHCSLSSNYLRVTDSDYSSVVSCVWRWHAPVVGNLYVYCIMLPYDGETWSQPLDHHQVSPSEDSMPLWAWQLIIWCPIALVGMLKIS